MCCLPCGSNGTYALANDISGERGWCDGLYDLLVDVSMLLSTLVVPSCSCISVPLLRVVSREV